MKLKVSRILIFPNGIVFFIRKKPSFPWWKGYKPSKSSCERIYKILLDRKKIKIVHPPDKYHNHYVYYMN